MDKGTAFIITIPGSKITNLHNSNSIKFLNEIVEFLSEDIKKNNHTIWNLIGNPLVLCVTHLIHKARGRFHISCILRRILEYLIEKVNNEDGLDFTNKINNTIVDAGNEEKIPDGYVIVALNYLRVAIKLKLKQRKNNETVESLMVVLDIINQIQNEYKSRRKNTEKEIQAKKRRDMFEIKYNDLEYKLYNNLPSYNENLSDEDA